MKRKIAEFDWLIQSMGEKGLSNKECAKRAGRSESTIRNWKKGHGILENIDTMSLMLNEPKHIVEAEVNKHVRKIYCEDYYLPVLSMQEFFEEFISLTNTIVEDEALLDPAIKIPLQDDIRALAASYGVTI